MKAILPFSIMCVGMFAATLDIQVVASSLQDIGGGLSAGQDEIGWVQTAYLIAEIIVIPLSGWLTRVFSTRYLFTASAAGFTLASMLCGLAWNIQSMILFRALQGMLGASMIPIVFTSSFHYFQGPRRVYAAAVIGTIASVAPTLGPVIGGYITDALNWRWLFYVNLAPGALVALGTYMLVDIDKPDVKLLRGADYSGIMLMALGLGTLEYFLEEGSRWNWFDDATIRDCAWISGISLLAFIIRSLMVKNPVADFRAFRNLNFAVGCFLSFVVGIGIFATVYLVPLFLGYVRGFSAWQTGTAVCAQGLASIIGVPIYILLAKRFDLRWIMLGGLVLFGLSMWNFSFLTSQWGWREMLVAQILRGLPQVACVAPAVTLGLGSLPPARLQYASGLFNMMRNLGGAVGIALCGAVLNDRTNFHFLVLASNLTPARAPVTATLAGIQAQLGGTADAHLAALRELWNLAYAQAETLAYADAFRAIMFAFCAAVIAAPFLRQVMPPATPVSEH